MYHGNQSLQQDLQAGEKRNRARSIVGFDWVDKQSACRRADHVSSMPVTNSNHNFHLMNSGFLIQEHRITTAQASTSIQPVPVSSRLSGNKTDRF